MTAFLLTWKESGWPHEEIVRMVAQREAQGYVEEPWRIAAYKMARAGDRVWVLRQGKGPSQRREGCCPVLAAPADG
jgi:hypothetical protein